MRPASRRCAITVTERVDYRDAFMVLPDPVLLVAVRPGGRMHCELANPAWLARICRPAPVPPGQRTGPVPDRSASGPGQEHAPDLMDVLPTGRREAFLDALGECATGDVPVHAYGWAFTPQSRAGQVVRVVCTWSAGSSSLPAGPDTSTAGPDTSAAGREAPRDGPGDPAVTCAAGAGAAPEIRYRDVFDNAIDQIALLELCDGGRFRILEVNRSMARAMGRSREEIVGAFQDELFDAGVDGTLVEAYWAAIEAGKPVDSQLVLDLPPGRHRFDSTIVPAPDPSGRTIRVVSIVRDITDREQAEHTLRRANRALQTLSSGNTALVRAVDEPSLLSGMCAVMVRVGGYRRAWIGYPGGSAELPVVPMAWDSSRREEAARVQPDPSWLGPAELLGQALAGGRPQLSRPAREPGEAGRQEPPGVAGAVDVAAGLILPLVHDGEGIGVLVVHSDDPDAFAADELALLTELAADLAYGIHNLRTRAEEERHEERLLKAMNATIRALADTTELRDPYTAGHQRRVAELAAAVGRKLGLSEDRVAGLYLASTIHDIGKISIPAEILSRPVPLSAVEYELMKHHVVAAYELLRGIEFPWPVADIVAQHHERCDGSGYPNGLRADDLLLESRILAVCDVVEAMSSHRPYRPGLGMEAALAEVLDGRGTRYDAEVVDACVALLRSGRFVFADRPFV